MEEREKHGSTKKNLRNGTDFADDMKTKQQNDPNGDGMKIKQSDYVPTT